MALAMYLAAGWSLHLAVFQGNVSPLWLGAGLGVSVLARWGLGLWPGLAVGLGLALLGNGTPPVAVAGVVLSNVAAQAGAAFLLRRFLAGRSPLESVRGVMQLMIFGAAVEPLISATIGVTTLWLAGAIRSPSFLDAWAIWAAGDLTGVLLVAPLVFAWSYPSQEWSTLPRAAEALLLSVIGFGVAVMAFGLVELDFSARFPFLVVPALVWAALRFGPRTVSSLLAGVATLAVLSTVNEWGPFIRPTLHESIAFLDSFIVIFAATGMILAATIHEREQSRRREYEANTAYRALLGVSPLAVIAIDTEARVTVWNRGAERMFGWQAGEVLGQPLPTVPAAQTEDFERLRELHRAGGALDSYETWRVSRDGRRVDVALSLWPVRDPSGKVTGSMGVMSDITERKHAERVQQATYEISSAALAATTLADLFRAIHRIIADLMPARNLYIALFDEAAGTLSFPYWVDERDPPPAPGRPERGLTEYVLRTGQPFLDRGGLYDSLVSRGEVEPVGTPSSDWLGVPLKFQDRTIGVLVAQSYDPEARYTERDRDLLLFVSTQVAMAIERRQAEDALRVSEARLVQAQRVGRLGSWEADIVADTLWWSEETFQLFGLDPEHFTPTNEGFFAAVHEDDREAVRAAAAHAVEQGEPYRIDHRIVRPDGQVVWVHEQAEIIRDADGRSIRMFGTAQDITERVNAERVLREREEQLQQALKMEAIGRLAGGVAHDFNNLLTSVLGHADLALSELKEAEPAYEDVREIRDAAVRAAGLTQQLLAFSRKQIREPKVVDLNAVVQGVSRMLGRMIGEDIELTCNLAPDVGAIRADPGQLEQVLVNLAVNARDAMPEGGRLTIGTLNLNSHDKGWIRLTVADTGHGMSETVQAHLFEPFFTTKGPGRGTGLGLSTVYGIVQQSGARVTVETAVGVGTKFLIDFPQVDGVLRPEPVAHQPATSAGNETILLVEDEDAVRHLSRRLLEARGYHVLAAASAEAAIKLAQEFAGTIHLLLTDVIMPGLSGPKLAQQLLPTRPGMRVLYMSGYTARELEGHTLGGEEALLLQKPFTPDAMGRMVREVLDRGRPSQGR